MVLLQRVKRKQIWIGVGMMLFALLNMGILAQAETAEAWGKRALSIQNRIDHDAPFYETTWPGTHNSFANADDDNLNADWTNQSMSLKQQLDSGIRELVFDVHYDNSAVRVCHNNSGVQIFGLGECIDGYTGNRKLSNALDDLVEWLDDGHRDEVILLKVELTQSAKNNINKVHKKIDNIDEEYYLPSAVSYHDDADYGCTLLPATLTKSKVLASGKNIVLFGSDCYSNGRFHDRVFSTDGLMEDYSDPDDVSDIRANTTDMTRVKDGYTKGGVLYGSGTLDSGKTKLRPSTVASYLSAGLNIFETYGFGAEGSSWKADGEYPVSAEDLVWSWDDSSLELNGSGSCVVLGDSSDRFHDIACTESYVAACRKLVDSAGERAYGEWALTETAVSFSDAENACSSVDDGEYVFATPRNKVELEKLVAIRNNDNIATNLWLNYQQIDDTWLADIGEADEEMLVQCYAGGSQGVCSVINEYLNLLDNSKI
ncbi:hypothetical protein [Shewanella surugensis]|uniref:Phosphatidylinositol diacylglycerol-lyase n=1 Tax=Shewanella surugensis TaxID=212020 RepID=A0ABT0LH99_9GAMM|nr:hypothetical protein [Shewanella surugensis]MCL1126687.1 hypothetical protein [Shewanella surugensis]